jgi:hypothetical protein
VQFRLQKMQSREKRERAIQLEKQATALLKGTPDISSRQFRSIDGVLTTRKGERRLACRTLRKACVAETLAYRQLPKDQRHRLAQRFKSERTVDPALCWDDWLHDHLSCAP